MGKIRRGRSEREEVSVITDDWVDQHRFILTPRDVEMLRIMAQFPVVKTEHLFWLTPPTSLRSGRELAPFYTLLKGRQICRDRIRKLYDYHFVNKYSPRLPLGEGTAPQYIWLDRAGYRLLDKGGRPPKQLSIEYRHHSNILDVYTSARLLELDGTISIDYIMPCYTHKPKTYNIEPDIILAFRKGNYGYRYFIEVDTCEKKESDEIKKLERYRDWELSGQWINEEWSQFYRRKFPTVLYLFSGNERKVNRRMEVFSKHAEEVECKSNFLPVGQFRDKIINLQA
ncbi:hypothetical protein 0305phi8-36p200 [Bacillus phage 0305phi8-36]|uniref:replication initiation by nicking n=1 Tax=Bacillus phage 0305phi8-36 TaxID=458639 RepID=UPI00015A1F38|nr:replication initiation by nicking [Bacillus phage 0305phi8-36]ABS83758.1 hypothetical protein 0305phi8-36p200 [Bacillus phage 0305phi8-36]